MCESREKENRSESKRKGIVRYKFVAPVKWCKAEKRMRSGVRVSKESEMQAAHAYGHTSLKTPDLV